MSFIGLKHSEETKAKMRAAQLGHPNYNTDKKGCLVAGQKLALGFPKSAAHREKLRLANIGKKHSEEAKTKMRGRTGAKCHLWKGGISGTKEYIRFWNRKSWAQRKKAGVLTSAVIQLVYESNIKRFGRLSCYLCLIPLVNGKETLEHKTPLCRGGDNTFSNLDIACRRCNSRKHSKTEAEYRDYLLQKGESI